MQADKNRRILIIDDNRSIHDDFRKILAERNVTVHLEALQEQLFGQMAGSPARAEAYDIDSAYQGEEGFAKVQQSIESGEPYALAFVDMRMPPGWDGLQTIEKIWSVDPALQIVICSAYSDYSWEDILARLGSSDRLLILKKPFDTAEVCQLACALTEKWYLAKHAQLKLDQLSSMVLEQTQELSAANHHMQMEIAAHRLTEGELRHSEHRYYLAAAAVNDGLFDWDLASGTVFYSRRWKAMLGYSDAEIGNTPEEWFSRVDPEHLPGLKAEIEQHLARRKENLDLEYRMCHQDGQFRWILCRGLADWALDGSPRQLAGSHTDITDRKLAEEQLRHEARHDPLTGLANRKLLMERLARACRRAERDPSFKFALLFLDLDHFKIINDQLGHSIGDQLLQAIAGRLNSAMRVLDTVSRFERDCLARLGGDEFVLVLEGVAGSKETEHVADRVQGILREPFELSGQRVVASTSIGIIANTDGYHSPEELLRDADTALYESKRLGRDRRTVFCKEMRTEAVARWEIETELRDAIEQNQLILDFQPIVTIGTGRIIELEALVRWKHPLKGIVPPDDFIPVAEETGLIIPLERWVLREACAEWQKWSARGFGDVALGVNLSARHLTQPGAVDMLAGLLEEFSMPPASLKVEITETALMDDSDVTLANLARLRDLAISIHLDDFGTGYSSLSYLHRMPISTLKIDRSFVGKMSEDKTSKLIVQAIVALAKALSMKVIAEGVETEAHRKQLTEMHCELAQGFLFSPPVSAADVPSLLEASCASTCATA